MISSSLRVQLTLWYTGVLALVLIVFAVITYEYLTQTAQRRTDRSLVETANAFSSTLLAEAADENQTLSAAAAETASTFRFPDRQVIVYDQDRKVLAATKDPENLGDHQHWFSPAEPPLPLIELLHSVSRSGQSYATISSRTGEIRLFATTAQSRGQTITIVVAQSLREQAETLAQARRGFYIGVPLALLLASLGGYFLARKSLAPVIDMSKQAARIGATNLDERLPVSGTRNELNRLAQIFNELLSRLDSSFKQQRRFMADASHELRTPVAIVRGESEVALSRDDRSPADYREALQIVNNEGHRLTRIVEDLFTLARADAGQYPLVAKNLYLDEAIGDCLRSVRSLVTRKGVDLQYQRPAEETPFRGDEALIRRMILNLVDNSIKYTPPGGTVSISLQHDQQQYLIAVSDTGGGIPPEAQPHVFERFFRVDKARSRAEDADGDGAGLGLSIALWIAELHGGRIVLDRSAQTGTTFIASLPTDP